MSQDWDDDELETVGGFVAAMNTEGKLEKIGDIDPEGNVTLTVSPAPSVGRIVHYVSFGSPVREDGTQVYTPQCRAAIVTEVSGEANGNGQCVALCVLNPTGQFFNEHICQDETEHAGGTWHWPERV
jgi:hypothetical protein